jgi:hypothetical protein
VSTQPDASTRPNFGTVTERLPGGQIYRITADGKRIAVPEESALTQWPNETGMPKPGK